MNVCHWGTGTGVVSGKYCTPYVHEQFKWLHLPQINAPMAGMGAGGGGLGVGMVKGAGIKLLCTHIYPPIPGTGTG